MRPIACSVHLLRNTNATLIQNTNRSFKKKYNHNCCNCFVPKFHQIHIQKLFYKQINNLNTKLFQLRYVSLQCFEEFNIVHTNYNCIYKSFGRSHQARVCCKYYIGQVFNALTHSQNDQIFEGRPPLNVSNNSLDSGSKIGIRGYNFHALDFEAKQKVHLKL